MVAIISPILKDRHKEFRAIYITYNPNSRMRRLAFEIEKHFKQHTAVIYKRKVQTKKILECSYLRVKTLGDFENYLYNLKFKKIASDVVFVGDVKWSRHFETLEEYIAILPHFQKSFFNENTTIIKNVDDLK